MELAQIITNAPRYHQRRILKIYSSRPMRILYRKQRKTGPETLPTRWVEELIPQLKEAKRVVGLDPNSMHFQLGPLNTDNIEDRKRISEWIVMQYDQLISNLYAWVKRYNF